MSALPLITIDDDSGEFLFQKNGWDSRIVLAPVSLVILGIVSCRQIMFDECDGR